MVVCHGLYYLSSGDLWWSPLATAGSSKIPHSYSVFSVICVKVPLLTQIEAGYSLYFSGLCCRIDAQAWVHFCSLDQSNTSLSCQTLCSFHFRVFLAFMLTEHSYYFTCLCACVACLACLCFCIVIELPFVQKPRRSRAKMIVSSPRFAQMQAVPGCSRLEKPCSLSLQ